MLILSYNLCLSINKTNAIFSKEIKYSRIPVILYCYSYKFKRKTYLSSCFKYWTYYLSHIIRINQLWFSLLLLLILWLFLLILINFSFFNFKWLDVLPDISECLADVFSKLILDVFKCIFASLEIEKRLRWRQHSHQMTWYIAQSVDVCCLALMDVSLHLSKFISLVYLI